MAKIKRGNEALPFRVTTELSVDAWRKFVEKHPAGNVFQTPEIADVFRRAKLHKPMLFAAIDGNEEIMSLILLVRVKTASGLPSRVASRCIAYGGILHPTDGEYDAAPKLLEFLDFTAKRASLFTEIRNITDMADFKEGITKCGYIYFDYLNYLVRLDRDPDKIFQGFSRTRRQNIRNLEKKGILVEEVRERKDIGKVYDILKSTYARIRVPLADISLFQAAFDIMYPLGMAKFYLAKVGKEETATAVALLYKKCIYLWYLGTKGEFLKINPASLIVWHLVKWGSQNGYEILDFLGAGKPEEPYGVREFKKRFGGDEVSYGRYQKLYSPLLLKISERAYSLYRKFS